jgi:hypothetical protein
MMPVEKAESYADKALRYAETVGIIEYQVNGNLMEYWSFFSGEGWYFIRRDLDKEEDVFRGAHIPFIPEMGVPSFLKTNGGATLYNYNIG